MLLLTSTSDVLRIVTDSTATVDVHASWVDRSGSTDVPGSTNTAISSATTTTIVGSPASSTARNIRTIIIRNKSGVTSVTVTTQIFNGSSAFEIDKRVLAPGAALNFVDGVGFFQPVTGASSGNLTCVAALGDGTPGDLMEHVQRNGNVAATPGAITVSNARCSLFRLRQDITINRIRGYGVGATTGIYQVAIYRYSDLARLTAQLSINTAVAAWFSAGSALNLTLSKDVNYFIACSCTATGSTAGIGCIAATAGATTGAIQIDPNSLPGGLAPSAGNLRSYFFQFSVTSGALPDPANTLTAQSLWTGGMPAFWLDNADV